MESIRNQTFPAKSVDEWKAKAEESLKGKKIEALQSTTYENINLKPLYTPQDEQNISIFPGGEDYRRGINPLGYVLNEWKVAQRINAKTPEELKEKLHQAVTKGQTAISIEVSPTIAANFSNIVGELNKKYPFAINAKWEQAALLKQLQHDVDGYIANDPISLFANAGEFVENNLQRWPVEVLEAAENFPKLRTVLVDATTYHNGGANAVQELGIALATGVFYLEKLTQTGLSLQQALSKMVFQFSIGSNFFMEVAKLRAARIVWNRISELYGASEDERKMHIAATTSYFTKTLHDHHVNILRSANEAFAAVLGGVQYLHVDPFDTITGSNDFSERVARNVQLILKEEAHLQKAVDPAGGSWYIEAITSELAEKAWDYFKEIDANGGILEALTSNWLQQEITSTFEKKSLDIQQRKQSMIGTNVYAKLDESIAEYPEKPVASGRDFKAIPLKRLSEPFEELRLQAKQLAEKAGSVPTVGMVCLGNLKQHKPRLDFMKSFLAAGGVQPVESGPIHNVEDAKEFFGNLNTNFVCFCGNNEQYEQTGHEILTGLKSDFPKVKFLLAGLPEKDLQNQWLSEGISQFIHVKSNCYETLKDILSEIEVSPVEA